MKPSLLILALVLGCLMRAVGATNAPPSAQTNSYAYPGPSGPVVTEKDVLPVTADRAVQIVRQKSNAGECITHVSLVQSDDPRGLFWCVTVEGCENYAPSAPLDTISSECFVDMNGNIVEEPKSLREQWRRSSQQSGGANGHPAGARSSP